MKVRHGGTEEEAGVRDGDTVLSALQRAGIVVDAPCGGTGTCKKCRVLVRTAGGVSYRLACQTPAADALEVTVPESRPMEVSTAGELGPWEPDGRGAGYGAAIDVGTTTVVTRLYDLADGRLLGARGASNPELVYGADVVARISACSEGHLGEMRGLLCDQLAADLRSLSAGAGIAAGGISRIFLAGNTTMESIAAGVDPTPIGVSPYVPETLFGDERELLGAGARGLPACAEFAPCVAGYVGGDISCGLLAVDAVDADDPVLLLDLGTNGEIALGDASGITSCATAAGPVFEGANIKYGMPAYPGAISRVRRDAGGGLRLETIGGGEPVGICGTGVIDAVALMLESGIVGESGRILPPRRIDPELSRGLERLVGEEDGQPCLRLTPEISITQKDVRSLQLAKAAVGAGIQVLAAERGIDLADVSRLCIAGGFGEYLDLDSAARVGLIPAELRARAESVGNTSIEGASAVLLSGAARDALARTMAACGYVELSTHPDFNDLYVDAMFFG